MSVMHGLFIAPTYLMNATPVVASMVGAPMPATIKLKVTAGDTLVLEQSQDGGQTYEPPEATITASQSFVMNSGCTHIRVTRTAGTSTTSYFSVC